MNQHTVPKFLLKNFTKDKKRRVWVYDKHAGARFRANVRNITAERGFYDLSIEGLPGASLEPSLQRIEDRAAPLLQEIVRQKNIAFLKEDSRAVLAVFFAVLFVRTKEYRLRYENLGRLIQDRLRQMSASGELLQSFDSDEDESKLTGLRDLVLLVPQFAPHFLNKHWALFEAPPGLCLYTSDNPVTLHNEIDLSPYGNIGLTVRGIEIYVPLASTLTLALLCPSVAAPFLQAAANFRLLDRLSPGLAEGVLKNPAFTRAYCTALETGSPFRLIDENVTMLNSLQVMYSSRCVYCENDQFPLVETMIRDNPKYKEGLRPTLA